VTVTVGLTPWPGVSAYTITVPFIVYCEVEQLLVGQQAFGEALVLDPANKNDIKIYSFSNFTQVYNCGFDVDYSVTLVEKDSYTS